MLQEVIPCFILSIILTAAPSCLQATEIQTKENMIHVTCTENV